MKNEASSQIKKFPCITSGISNACTVRNATLLLCCPEWTLDTEFSPAFSVVIRHQPGQSLGNKELKREKCHKNDRDFAKTPS